MAWAGPIPNFALQTRSSSTVFNACGRVFDFSFLEIELIVAPEIQKIQKLFNFRNKTTFALLDTVEE